MNMDEKKRNEGIGSIIIIDFLLDACSGLTQTATKQPTQFDKLYELM